MDSSSSEEEVGGGKWSERWVTEENFAILTWYVVDDGVVTRSSVWVGVDEVRSEKSGEELAYCDWS